MASFLPRPICSMLRYLVLYDRGSRINFTFLRSSSLRNYITLLYYCRLKITLRIFYFFAAKLPLFVDGGQRHLGIMRRLRGGHLDQNEAPGTGSGAKTVHGQQSCPGNRSGMDKWTNL